MRKYIQYLERVSTKGKLVKAVEDRKLGGSTVARNTVLCVTL